VTKKALLIDNQASTSGECGPSHHHYGFENIQYKLANEIEVWMLSDLTH